MPYATLPVAGDFNGTNVLTSTNRPTGAVGIGILLPGGGFKKLIAFGNVPGTSAPGGFTRIAQGINLAGAQALLTNQAPAAKVVSNVLYAIEDSAWNGGNGDNLAWVNGLDASTYNVVGAGFVNGALQVVTVDVAAGTYVPFAAGAAGTPRDIYDVPTAKRKEVVDANVPAYAETDSSYYGKIFVDEVYGPGQPAKYECLPSAPATTGGATAWKWFRIDIL